MWSRWGIYFFFQGILFGERIVSKKRDKKGSNGPYGIIESIFFLLNCFKKRLSLFKKGWKFDKSTFLVIFNQHAFGQNITLNLIF